MTKERLRDYKKIKLEHAQLAEKVEEIETALYSPKIPRLTGVPSSGSPTGSAMEALADKHTEVLQHYRTKRDELAAEMLEIERAIETLDATARMLLRYRYIDGLTWEEVAERAHFSLRQVHNVHSQALQRLKREEGET